MEAQRLSECLAAPQPADHVALFGSVGLRSIMMSPPYFVIVGMLLVDVHVKCYFHPQRLLRDCTDVFQNFKPRKKKMERWLHSLGLDRVFEQI